MRTNINFLKHKPSDIPSHTSIHSHEQVNDIYKEKGQKSKSMKELKLCGWYVYQLSVDEENYPRQSKTRKSSSFPIYSPLLMPSPAAQTCSEAPGQSQFWLLPAAVMILSTQPSAATAVSMSFSPYL